MFSLRVLCPPETVEYVSADLWEAGTCGIREIELGHGTELIAGFAVGPGETTPRRDELLARFAEWNPRWEEEEPTDWVEATKAGWPPREVGETWFVAAPWNDEATPAGRRRLVQNPGLACGTGDHPCTQMALAALSDLVNPGDSVADIGSGSGILAIAALLAGAGRAVAADLDPGVVPAARENLALNFAPPELAPCLLVTGSAACLASGTFDVTVANISSTVILSLFEDLLRITKPGGSFILTGFGQEEARAFVARLAGSQAETAGDWCCLRGKRPIDAGLGLS